MNRFIKTPKHGLQTLDLQYVCKTVRQNQTSTSRQLSMRLLSREREFRSFNMAVTLEVLLSSPFCFHILYISGSCPCQFQAGVSYALNNTVVRQTGNYTYKVH